jgi:plastocyanin
MHVRTATPLLLVLAALALGACGDAGAPVRERNTAFTITLDDYLIRPQEVRVPKGKRLTVTVANHGRLGHTFRIRSVNHVVLAMETIRPGESRSRSFKFAPGNYTMFCALANHEELGMYGRLTVG